ncbi:type II toxin-antitoxin system RelE/ParE family toxin [Rhizobium herbae]|uniref:Plasmid stabilization system protein ParE n=1 Tax=Rhizobium herbae TaxID=508661 RepID=A0ABS4ES05_9HYPH|nr:type II toxin-antitoxin system RelE/ParE family toxin [Rhizobium herbae]MBP1860729.1 plasmid stabilization system protein ParE [Rhizobium herbae]
MRQRKLKLTPRALRDLRDVYEYIALIDPISAKRFVNRISVKMEWIAKSGLTGVQRDFIPGLRAFPYRDRCIYFLADNSTMTVLRILHGRQDITPEDFPESEI